MPLLSCPKCRGQLRLPESSPGRKVRCPRCQTVFVADDQADSDEDQGGGGDAFGFLDDVGQPGRRRSGRRPPPEKRAKPQRKVRRRRVEEEDDEDDEDDEEDLDDHEKMVRSKAERRALSGQLDRTASALKFLYLGFAMYALAPNVYLLASAIGIFTGFILFIGIGALGFMALGGLGWVLQAVGGLMLLGGEKREGAGALAMAVAGATGLVMVSIPIAIVGGAIGAETNIVMGPVLLLPGISEMARLVLVMMFVSRLGAAIGDADAKRYGLRLAIYMPSFAIVNQTLFFLITFILADTFGIGFNVGFMEMPIGAMIFVGGFVLGTVLTWASIFGSAAFVCKNAADAAEEAA